LGAILRGVPWPTQPGHPIPSACKPSRGTPVLSGLPSRNVTRPVRSSSLHPLATVLHEKGASDAASGKAANHVSGTEGDRSRRAV